MPGLPLSTIRMRIMLALWVLAVLLVSTAVVARFAIVSHASTWLFALLGIGGGLAVVAGILTSRSIIRPLDVLVRHAERLGEGDLTARTAEPMPDELRILGDTLNRMSESLTRSAAIQRAAEEEIRGSEAGFRSFVENSPYGIFRSARDGRLLAVNRALVEILGYPSAGALEGRSLVEDICVASAAGGPPATQLLAGGPPVEGRWKRQDGSVITVRAWARVLRVPGSSDTCLEGFVEDVTPLRVAEQALRQSEKLAAVGHLVSGVGHELNNPLSAILLFAEDLLADARPAADTEALTNIRDQARRAREIVRDLLTFAQGGREVHTTIDAREVIEEMGRVVRPRLQAQEIELEVTTGQIPLDVDVDRAGIEQVLLNLVVNAGQAIGRRGIVRMSARRDGEDVIVEVIDDGPGIPARILPDVFNPFFTTKEPGQGTGLGLAVARAIVERHRGRLRVENRVGPGERGARFTMQLPLARAKSRLDARHADVGQAATIRPGTAPARESDGATPVVAQSPRAPGMEGPPHRLLVIDDEAAIRTALRRFFHRRQWVVDEALDGETGLRMLLEAPPDYYTIVISDLRMPGLSGIALHDRLAVERPELLRRLVLATGDISSTDVAPFLAGTKCPVLQKPYEFSALARIFDAIVAGQPAPT